MRTAHTVAAGKIDADGRVVAKGQLLVLRALVDVRAQNIMRGSAIVDLAVTGRAVDGALVADKPIPICAVCAWPTAACHGEQVSRKDNMQLFWNEHSGVTDISL